MYRNSLCFSLNKRPLEILPPYSMRKRTGFKFVRHECTLVVCLSAFAGATDWARWASSIKEAERDRHTRSTTLNGNQYRCFQIRHSSIHQSSIDLPRAFKPPTPCLLQPGTRPTTVFNRASPLPKSLHPLIRLNHVRLSGTILVRQSQCSKGPVLPVL